jgi:hypothetical protein
MPGPELQQQQHDDNAGKNHVHSDEAKHGGYLRVLTTCCSPARSGAAVVRSSVLGGPCERDATRSILIAPLAVRPARRSRAIYDCYSCSLRVSDGTGGGEAHHLDAWDQGSLPTCARLHSGRPSAHSQAERPARTPSTTTRGDHPSSEAPVPVPTANSPANAHCTGRSHGRALRRSTSTDRTDPVDTPTTSPTERLTIRLSALASRTDPTTVSPSTRSTRTRWPCSTVRGPSAQAHIIRSGVGKSCPDGNLSRLKGVPARRSGFGPPDHRLRLPLQKVWRSPPRGLRS